MSPEQFSLAQLQAAQLQLWITGLAIFLGPLTGVLFTIWFQQRKERREAKHRLFLTLMADRKPYNMPTIQVAQALNTIDVVFSNNHEVVRLWHSYYNLLAQKPSEDRNHTWLELLAAMASDLGYKQIKQTDLDKFYMPQGHVDWQANQVKAAQEWLAVLQRTHHFIVESKPADPE
ncbi:MAG: DUF6680 family protein [Rudaea sp.]